MADTTAREPSGLRKFFSEIFQDIDGGYSAKRTAFFVFVILFVFLTVTAYFKVVDGKTLGFVQSSLDKVTDILKWLGGFIVVERAPQVFGPKKQE